MRCVYRTLSRGRVQTVHAFSTRRMSTLFPPYQMSEGLSGAEQVLLTLPEVAQADELVQRGKFTPAAEALERALSICAFVPDPLAAVAVRTRLGKIHFLSGHQAKEEKERGAVCAALAGVGQADHTSKHTDLCVDSALAYIVCLLRGGKFDLALETTGMWLAQTEHNQVKAKFLMQAALCGILSGREVDSERKALEEALVGLGSLSLAADIELVLGDCHRHALDSKASRKSYRAALDLYADQDPIGEVAALLKLADKESVSQAVEVAEETWGNGHPLLAECLRVMAKIAGESGDATTSEGLFRGCFSKLEALETAVPTTPATQISERMLMYARADYAKVLCHMEWNGNVRCRDAALLLEKKMNFGVNYPLLTQSAIEKAKDGDAVLLLVDLEAMDRTPRVDWWVSIKYGC